MSISVSITSTVSQNNTVSSSTTSQSAIEALQKKLVSLQKDLKEATSTPTPEGQAKAKLIQLQITATQTQLQQLIQQKAKESAEKQNYSKTESGKNTTQISNERSKSQNSLIDEYA